MDVGKMGPVFCSGTKSFSVGDVGVPSLDPLDLFLDEAVVGGGHSLSLLRSSIIRRWRTWNLMTMIIEPSPSGHHNNVIGLVALVHQTARTRVLFRRRLIRGRMKEESVTQVMLKVVHRRRQRQPAHVHWQQVGTVAASHRHRLEQTIRRNTHREDGVTEAAMDIAELLGGWEVVQR